MHIGIIGAGKVGFSLGKFFVQGGVPVTGYFSRHRESAQEAALFTHTKPFDSLETLVQQSDALFLTVPDGAIASVFDQLRQFEISGKQICHCSGAWSAQDAFPGIQTTGAYSYSIHPLFPISSKFSAWRELPGAFFCLEGSGPHLPQWEALLTGLGASVRIIPSQEKIRYHAACAIASNLMCALAAESLSLLETCGFSEAEGRQALAPLMRANLDHILKDGPQKALTGPVERNDTQTVARHLACLSQPEQRQLYAAASQLLVQLAQNKHQEANYGPMTAILKEGSTL